jgi:ketosteroid isomerase-like protein
MKYLGVAAILALAVATGARAEVSDSEAVVRAKFAAFNRHSVPEIVSLYAPDAQINASNFCRVRRGKDEVARTYNDIFALAPDATDEVQETVTQGDRVAVRFIMHATIGGRLVSLQLMNFFTVRGGLIVRDEGLFDTAGLKCTA